MKNEKNYAVDMTNGPLFAKIVRFALPLILSGVLQLMFNAVDMIVAGQCVGESALAAIGSTGAIINLLTNVFIGLSIGTNVVAAQNYGAGKTKELEKAVHTSIALSILSGIILSVIGVIFSRQLLEWMGSPEDVIGQSTIYMQIYFAGITSNLVYNFGAAILRAVGDTKRPLYYLIIAGVINVILNLGFVLIFDMGVAGVAAATVLSQCISAALVIMCIAKKGMPWKLQLRKITIHKAIALRIIRIGLPAGLQGTLFSLSNVVVQSSINSFGTLVMAGNTAGMNIEGFVYIAMNAFHQTALSFIGQNVGANKYARVRKAMMICVACVFTTGVVTGGVCLLNARFLLGIYSSDPEVIAYGVQRMTIILLTYYMFGTIDTFTGGIRGMGYSVTPMIVTLIGVCGLRIGWVFTVFQAHRSLPVLYMSYPVTWVITLIAQIICFVLCYRNLVKKGKEAELQIQLGS